MSAGESMKAIVGRTPGHSSGLNGDGAIDLAEELGAGHTIVTEATDTGSKCLAGDLYHV